MEVIGRQAATAEAATVAAAAELTRIAEEAATAAWATQVALDRSNNDNDLWLSSGNRIPAHLYKVVGGAPQRMYTSADGSISGFFFEPNGNIVYANWDNRIHRLTDPDLSEASSTFRLRLTGYRTLFQHYRSGYSTCQLDTL